VIKRHGTWNSALPWPNHGCLATQGGTSAGNTVEFGLGKVAAGAALSVQRRSVFRPNTDLFRSRPWSELRDEPIISRSLMRRGCQACPYCGCCRRPRPHLTRDKRCYRVWRNCPGAPMSRVPARLCPPPATHALRLGIVWQLGQRLRSALAGGDDRCVAVRGAAGSILRQELAVAGYRATAPIGSPQSADRAGECAPLQLGRPRRGKRPPGSSQGG
jgi:hypothetical protein